MIFFCKEKEIKLSNRVIKIKRQAVGYFYRLLYNLVDINNQNKRLNSLSKYLSDKEIIRQVAEILTKLKALNKAFSYVVAPFISVKWQNVRNDDKKAVIEGIIEFNSFETGSNDNDITKEDIEKNFRFMVAFLMEKGYTITQAYNEVDNYQAEAMLKEWTNIRIITMNDIRVALNASGEEYKNYINELKGFRKLSMSELREVMNGKQ